MKVKKYALLLAGILGAASLAACTATSKKIDWNNYWQYDVNAGGEPVDERLTYTVTYEKGSGNSALGYTLNYQQGSYVTTLQKGSNKTYTYTAELHIPVVYQFGDKEEVFEDSVVTALSFVDEGNNYRPVTVTKTVKSHTPARTTVSTIEDCYSFFHYTTVTEYTENKGTATIYDHLSDATETVPAFEYGTGDYSYLDNEQILLGMRAVPLSTTSGSVEFYNPFMKNTQMVNFSFEEKTGGEFSHTVNGNPLSSKNISYRVVSLTLNDKNPGATQKAWIAASDTTDKNLHRNVMLYLETPLSYSLGALKYTLTSVENLEA